jgi:hypothetical protein
MDREQRAYLLIAVMTFVMIVTFIVEIVEQLDYVTKENMMLKYLLIKRDDENGTRSGT